MVSRCHCNGLLYLLNEKTRTLLQPILLFLPKGFNDFKGQGSSDRAANSF